MQTLRRLAPVAAVVAIALPSHAAAQTLIRPAAAVGTADVDDGFVGQLGVRVLPRADAWVHVRADGTLGRLRGASVRAATVALEAGLPETRAPSARPYVLLGASTVKVGPAGDGGIMAGAGARLRLGAVALSAEIRFQPGFSPLLAGLTR